MLNSSSPLSLSLVLAFTLILPSGCGKTDVADSTADKTPSQTADGAADQTVDEFHAYAATVLHDFSQTQLKTFAANVDQDGDGVVTNVEFNNRFEVLDQFREAELSIVAPAISSTADATLELKSDPAAIPTIRKPGEVTVLLITAEELVDSWQPYAKWKSQGGKSTRIISVESIAKKYKAKNIQEQIRLCVRDHIDRYQTRWIILGGDSLPGGNGLVPGGHTTMHAQEPEGIPTDIVYLSKTDWDADGDGIYGEWEDDRKAISYPDGSVGLGRIPVRTAADVKAFTEKVIAYESRYPTGDFAQQMVYTCTDNPAYAKLRKSWDGHVSKVWQQGKVSRFFSEVTPWDKKDEPGSYDLSAEHLVSLINGKTTGKLHIHGHGHLPGWVLEDSMFSAKHVGQLKNDGAYPLITTVSCNTGEYDSPEDPSIVESMIRQPQGGSVAVVAPIRTGKPHFHERSDFRLMVLEGKLDGTTMTMTRYWSHGLGRGLSTGEALMQAKADMTEDALKTPGYHLCICELNLLGDPTLGMRSKSPRTPKLIAPKTIGTGKQTIVIETDAPNSTICLWRGNAIHAMKPTDATGKATFEYSNSTAGTLLATLSGPNLNRVTAQIEVK